MFPAQRIEALKRIIKEQKTVDIATLCNMLQVSNVTIRKYLDKLEDEGYVVKVHGGAMLAEQTDDDDTSAYSENYQDKEHIANLAKTVLEDSDNIFIGHGSTCLQFAKKIVDKRNLTVLTNNINVVNELAPHISNLQLIGGDIAYNNGFMHSYGHKSINHFEGIFVQKAFITFDGIDFKAGLTTNETTSIDLYKKLNKIAKQVIILADYTKFNKIGLHHIANITDYNIYISNEKLASDYKKFLYESNIKILTSYNL